MIKKISWAFVLLSHLNIMPILSAGSDEEIPFSDDEIDESTSQLHKNLNQNNKRTRSITNNDIPKKIQKTSKKEFKNHLLNNKFKIENYKENIDDFLNESSSFLLSPNYNRNTQNVLLEIAENPSLDIKYKLNAADILEKSEFIDPQSKLHTHKMTSIKAYTAIACGSNATEDIQNTIISVLLKFALNTSYLEQSFNALQNIAAHLANQTNIHYDFFDKISVINLDEFIAIISNIEAIKNVFPSEEKTLDFLKVIIAKTNTTEHILVFTESLKDLTDDTWDYDEFINFLQFINIKVSVNQFKSVTNTIKTTAVWKKYSVIQCIELIKGLLSIKEESWEEIVYSTNLIFDKYIKNSNADYYCIALKALAKLKLNTKNPSEIDLSEINELMQKARTLDCHNIWTYDDYAHFIVLVSDIEQNQRNTLIALIGTLSDKIPNGATWVNCLKELLDVKETDRPSVINSATKIKNLKQGIVIRDIAEIKQYIEKEQESFIDYYIKYQNYLENHSIIDNSPDDYSKMDNYIIFLQALSCLPEELREIAFNNMLSRDPNLPKTDQPLSEDEEEEYDDDLCECKYIQLTFTHFLWKIIQFTNPNSNTKEKIFLYWEKILNRDDEIISDYLSSFIEENYQDFELIEEHPLVQLAIRVKIVLSESDDPQNPYKIHDDLLEKRKEEIDFTKINTFLNPEFFKKLSGMQIDPASIPTIDPMILQLVLEIIEVKITDNPILQQSIMDMTGSSFNKIKLSVLGGDQYLIKLLKAPLEHKVAAQFKCLLNYLLSLDKTDGTNDKLSSHEMAILQTLSSIVDCSIGQDGAIVEAYSFLPPEAKLRNTRGQHFKGATMDKSQFSTSYACEFLYSIIQENIETIFVGANQLLVEVCGTPDIEQAVHQGLYLRNLIGDLSGSQHGVKFDLNTQVLYESLLKLSRQEAVKAFYKYIETGIHNHITYIRSKINQELNKKNTSLYNQLVILLEGHPLEYAFDITNDDYSITYTGVERILIAIGVLKQPIRLF